LPVNLCSITNDALGWANYRPFGPESDKTVILKLNKHNHLRDLPWKMSEIRRLITDGRLVCAFEVWISSQFFGRGELTLPYFWSTASSLSFVDHQNDIIKSVPVARTSWLHLDHFEPGEAFCMKVNKLLI
jgi:hypothetical protein